MSIRGETVLTRIGSVALSVQAGEARLFLASKTAQECKSHAQSDEPEGQEL